VFLSRKFCHAQEKGMEMDVILNWGLSDPTWEAAKFIYMPILSTTIQFNQRVSNIVAFLKFLYFTLMLKITEKRLLIRGRELMPHKNPPTIFRTPDNMEWTFLETFPDYEKLQKFRHRNKCQLSTSQAKNEKALRMRYWCLRKLMNNCKFMLLALKTTKEGYHVYKHGEHNHAALESRGKCLWNFWWNNEIHFY
jgi:hypothetical protein